MKKINFLFLMVVAFTIIYAHSSYTGYTRKTNTNGCSCHKSANPAITVVIDGPAQVKAGSTNPFTVAISGGTGSQVSVDIATSAGTLQPFDSALKLSGTELITNGVKTYSSGKYTYTFNYTAPATLGNQTLYATGLSSTSSGWNFAPDKIVNVVSTTDVNDETFPREFSLEQNYPNPFNPETVIRYNVQAASHITLKVFDVLGNEVATVVDEFKQAGTYNSQFSIFNYSPRSTRVGAGELPSGVYFYRLTAGNFSETKKMLYLK